MKPPKIIPALTSAVLLLTLLSACAFLPKNSTAAMEKELGLDCSGGKELSSYDTHSGNGDGVSCLVLQFPDDRAAQQIQSSGSWMALPLDETAQALLYGVSDGDSGTGPLLTDGDGQPLVPEVQNGWYLLLDRYHSPGAEEPLLDRGAFNVTLALYDQDAQILYYCKLDT